jgi:hypothetical protein
MDGNFMPWYMGDDAATVADWVAAFQHLSKLMKAEGTKDSANVQIVWNPADINWTNQPVTSAYPGDQYVDVIAADAYSPVYPLDLYDWSADNGSVDSSIGQWMASAINREHYWTYPSADQWNPTGQAGTGWSLLDTIALAEAHGKPIAVAETGAGGNGTTDGPVDDPAFPAWLASELSQPGAPKVAFVNIWDAQVSDGNWDFSSANADKPLEAAAWARYFGAGSATTTQDRLVLRVSEDAWQGNAQFTVSVDGHQLGGTYTVTASHAAGQWENFVFSGIFGPGAHTVSIDFINDAWGGSSSTDRNLYLQAISYDGTAFSDQEEFQKDGTRRFTVQATTPDGTATVTDTAGSRMTMPLISTGAQGWSAGQTGLEDNVYQSVNSSGVLNLWTGTQGLLNKINLSNSNGVSIHLANFTESDVSLSGASTTLPSTLVIDDAERGSIALGSGDYNVTFNALSSDTAATSNTVRVTEGSGDDSFTLNGYSGITRANIYAGSGTEIMRFVNTGAVTVWAGSGDDTVIGGDGRNTFVAGTGRVDVTGGAAADTYIFHAGDGVMTVENFSLQQGDRLLVDSALESSVQETSTSSATVLTFGAGNTEEIVLKGVSSLPLSAIHWS